MQENKIFVDLNEVSQSFNNMYKRAEINRLKPFDWYYLNYWYSFYTEEQKKRAVFIRDRIFENKLQFPYSKTVKENVFESVNYLPIFLHDNQTLLSYPNEVLDRLSFTSNNDSMFKDDCFKYPVNITNYLLIKDKLNQTKPFQFLANTFLIELPPVIINHITQNATLSDEKKNQKRLNQINYLREKAQMYREFICSDQYDCFLNELEQIIISKYDSNITKWMEHNRSTYTRLASGIVIPQEEIRMKKRT